MKKDGKKILLKHHSGWCIMYDFGFPSGNYIVTKADRARPMQKHSVGNIAYCGSLESALKCLYSQIIIFHSVENKKFCGKIKDLQKAINQAHKDFEQLLKPKLEKQK